MRKLLLLALLAGLSGCIQRTLTINSEPQGARVFINRREVGETPLNLAFTHYGSHDILLLLKGYAPYRGVLVLKAPGWAVFPLDAFTEALCPARLKDAREFTITLAKPPRSEHPASPDAATAQENAPR